MNKLKHTNMLSSVILQMIVARKGSSQVSLRNRSKKGEPEYIRSRAEKTFRKHQKIIADDEHDTSQINDFHAFKQLLFIYFYNFICLLIWLCWIFLVERSLFWLRQAGATLELKCVDFSFW